MAADRSPDGEKTFFRVGRSQSADALTPNRPVGRPVERSSVLGETLARLLPAAPPPAKGRRRSAPPPFEAAGRPQKGAQGQRAGRAGEADDPANPAAPEPVDAVESYRSAQDLADTDDDPDSDVVA